MNQITLNGIKEDFYAKFSALGSYLGKVVSVIRENPSAVVVAIIVLAAALLVEGNPTAIVNAVNVIAAALFFGVNCYRYFGKQENAGVNAQNALLEQNFALIEQNFAIIRQQFAEIALLEQAVSRSTGNTLIQQDR